MQSLLKPTAKKMITNESYKDLDNPETDEPSVSNSSVESSNRGVESSNSAGESESEQTYRDMRLSRSDRGFAIYRSCLNASNDPTIILKIKEFGCFFDNSLAQEDIFYYNNAFRELQNLKVGQPSVACFKNKIFELQKNIVKPLL